MVFIPECACFYISSWLDSKKGMTPVNVEIESDCRLCSPKKQSIVFK